MRYRRFFQIYFFLPRLFDVLNFRHFQPAAAYFVNTKQLKKLVMFSGAGGGGGAGLLRQALKKAFFSTDSESETEIQDPGEKFCSGANRSHADQDSSETERIK